MEKFNFKIIKINENTNRKKILKKHNEIDNLSNFSKFPKEITNHIKTQDNRKEILSKNEIYNNNIFQNRKKSLNYFIDYSNLTKIKEINKSKNKNSNKNKYSFDYSEKSFSEINNTYNVNYHDSIGELNKKIQNNLQSPIENITEINKEQTDENSNEEENNSTKSFFINEKKNLNPIKFKRNILIFQNYQNFTKENNEENNKKILLSETTIKNRLNLRNKKITKNSFIKKINESTKSLKNIVGSIEDKVLNTYTEQDYNFDLINISNNKKNIKNFNSKKKIEETSSSSPISIKSRKFSNDNFNKKKIYFIKSIFSNSEAVLFINNSDNIIFKNPHCEKYNKNIKKFSNYINYIHTNEIENIILFKAYKDTPKCITVPLEHSGCKQTKNLKKANLIWKLFKFDEILNLIKTLTPYQKYNHFPKTFQLGRKDNLWKHFKRYKRKFPNDYNYHPISYILPDEQNEFKLSAKSNPSFVWIIKPLASSRGRGIRLLTDLEDIPKECLICKYIEKPHLINNIKYDLRIYVLITSFSPLKIFLFKDGLVRFASEEYKKDDKENIFIHLTNYAINKNNKNYDKTDDNSSGSKWTLNAYEKFFQANNIHDKFLFILEKIKDIIIKTILTAFEESASFSKLYTKNDNVLFELYGFDIIVDNEFNPWLLEVNVNPSLNCDTDLDYNIKTNLITDLINIIGIKHNGLEENERNIVGKKLSNKNKKNNNFVLLPSIIKNNLDLNNQKNCINHIRIENKRKFICEDPDYKFNFTDEIIKNFYQNFLKNYEDELFRSSKFTNYELIFPLGKNIKNYSKFFKYIDDENIVLWKWILSNKPIEQFD